ncbi:MAG: TldD/PmbA family protein [Nitrospirae bacterium]|nr:MAG: TldD/PmbA family protein [Nitrospirota bacterium]
MIDDLLLEKLIKQALKRGGDYADVFVERRVTSAVQLEDDRVEKVTGGSDSGIGIRLIYNGKTAYAYSNDFSEGLLFELASTVSKIASAGASPVPVNLKRMRPEKKMIIALPPSEVPLHAKVDMVMRGNSVARKSDGRIVQATVIYRDLLQQVKILTSEGTLCEDERVYTLGVVQVVAASDGVIQTGYEPVGGHAGFEIFNGGVIEGLAEKAVKRATMMLKAERAPAGRMPVVISSEAGGTMVHEAVGHGLEADLVQQGLSVYSDKKGQEIASGIVTVIDDATIPNKRGSFLFDDEGVPSQQTVLVDKGILTSYMYDKRTSMKDGVLSTGNGRRESYENKPIPRMTNTFIASGEASPDEVLHSVHKGLFVKKMGGGQVNTVTGDFVFDVQEGYLIENGATVKPVRGATLIGNGPEILKSIDMVASDMGFSIGTCGKDGQGVPVSDAMPTLRIPEMVVGGEIK